MNRDREDAAGGISRAEIERAMASRDWSDAVVDDSAPPAMVSMSGRFPTSVAARIMTDAQERGLKPSQVLRELVDEAYAARDQADDELVTLRPSQVLRALRNAGRPAA